MCLQRRSTKRYQDKRGVLVLGRTLRRLACQALSCFSVQKPQKISLIVSSKLAAWQQKQSMEVKGNNGGMADQHRRYLSMGI